MLGRVPGVEPLQQGALGGLHVRGDLLRRAADCGPLADRSSRSPGGAREESRCSNSPCRSVARPGYREWRRRWGDSRWRFPERNLSRRRAGKPLGHMPRVHENATGPVRVRLRGQGVNKGHVVDVPGQVRQQARDLLAAFAARHERPRAFHQIAVLALKRDEVVSPGQGLAVPLLEFRFVLPKIHVRGRAPGRRSGARGGRRRRNAFGPRRASRLHPPLPDHRSRDGRDRFRPGRCIRPPRSRGGRESALEPPHRDPCRAEPFPPTLSTSRSVRSCSPARGRTPPARGTGPSRRSRLCSAAAGSRPKAITKARRTCVSGSAPASRSIRSAMNFAISSVKR